MPLCSAIWNFLRNIKTDTVVCCCCCSMVMGAAGDDEYRMVWVGKKANSIDLQIMTQTNWIKTKKNTLTERIKSNWIGQMRGKKRLMAIFMQNIKIFLYEEWAHIFFLSICKTCHKLSFTKKTHYRKCSEWPCKICDRDTCLWYRIAYSNLARTCAHSYKLILLLLLTALLGTHVLLCVYTMWIAVWHTLMCGSWCVPRSLLAKCLSNGH